MNVQHLAETAATRPLTEGEMYEAVREMAGGPPPDGSAALLAALHRRGEFADEVVGAARALRDAAGVPPPVPPGLLDTCGTGGDRSGTFNVSTAAALVVAACGVPVAKHGNRSFSSATGSADVLEALGVDVSAPRERVLRGLQSTGIGFFFGPIWHPAVQAVAPVRRALRHRTIFNLLGPLTNPARAPYQLVGTGSPESAALLAAGLARLGTRHALVVSGEDGLDEVTLAGRTRVLAVHDGRVAAQVWAPTDFGLPQYSGCPWQVGSAAESAAVVTAVLADTPGPARDLVLANAAAGLFAAGRVAGLGEGVWLAASALTSGTAARLLRSWVRATRS